MSLKDGSSSGKERFNILIKGFQDLMRYARRIPRYNTHVHPLVLPTQPSAPFFTHTHTHIHRRIHIDTRARARIYKHRNNCMNSLSWKIKILFNGEDIYIVCCHFTRSQSTLNSVSLVMCQVDWYQRMVRSVHRK